MDETLNKDLDAALQKVIEEYQDIKYGVYRVALKLCRLQEIFKLEKIVGSSAINYVKTFLSNKLGKSVGVISDDTVTIHELQTVVDDMFKLSGVQVSSKFARLQKMLTILIFETYEDLKQNQVALLPVTLFFVIMGNDDIQTKYKLLFELYSGNFRMLSKSRTGLLLTHFVRITDIVRESNNFSNVSPAVQSCFEGILGSTISEQQYLRWLFREPQSIVWLPTLHRLNVSKTSVHNVQCATCKVRPIVGLRFQCLRCLDYDSCQICFLTRRSVTRSHRLDHPRQEYCLPAGGKEKVNAFARTVRNMVTKRYKRKSLSSSFLPIQQSDSSDELVEVSADFGDINHLADQEKKNLEVLVSKLKEENEKMCGTVEMLETSANDTVRLDEDHLILQNEVDMLNLHNRSLQNELDNLKCVVFSDNFVNGERFEQHIGDDQFNDSSSYPSQGAERDANISQHVFMPQGNSTTRKESSKKDKTRKSAQYSSRKEKYLRENKTESFCMHNEEDQLRHLLDILTTSMDLEHSPQKNNVNEAMLMAAEKVENELSQLIDHAINLASV